MNIDNLTKFKNLKISKKELCQRLGGDLYKVKTDHPVIVYSSDVINLLKAYQKGQITLDHLIDWTNVIWFTDLFCYYEPHGDVIADVLNILEELDEEGKKLTNDDINNYIQSLEENRGIYEEYSINTRTDPSPAQNLKLTLDLLPRGAWDKNLSKTLTQKEWDGIRQSAYERAEYKCTICGAENQQLEDHEVWEFNADEKTQKLIDIIAICKSCHMVKHFRHTKMIGGEEYAKKHFMKINQCAEQVFNEHYREAENRFNELSKIESWTMDTSALDKLDEKHIQS